MHNEVWGCAETLPRSLLPVRFCFSGMFFVSCLLVRECRGRDEIFFEKDDFSAVYFPLG